MKVKIQPTNVEFESDPNKSIMQLCHENGVHINSLCKGQPKCAECRVKIVQGDQNVFPPNALELALLGSNYYLDGRRLSCQVRAYGDVTIDVTEQVDRTASAHKKIRGFRSKDKTLPSHAVLDTLMLHEKPVEEKKPDNRGNNRNHGRRR